MSASASPPPPPLPRVTIQFCIQCKWNLRAAYFAQELLSTFGTALGEVALQPATGGVFTHTLWDRKTEGGFPETKELKRRLRDIIEPTRSLGHVDGHTRATTTTAPSPAAELPTTQPEPETEPSEKPIPRAINRLLPATGETERKFTPMDVDVSSRPASRQQQEQQPETDGEPEREVLNSRGKIVIGGSGGGGLGDDGFGFCRPGDEDCG